MLLVASWAQYEVTKASVVHMSAYNSIRDPWDSITGRSSSLPQIISAMDLNVRCNYTHW